MVIKVSDNERTMDSSLGWELGLQADHPARNTKLELECDIRILIMIVNTLQSHPYERDLGDGVVDDFKGLINRLTQGLNSILNSTN